MTVERSLECGSCRACCYHEMIVLHPEEGDEPWRYQTEMRMNPLSGRPVEAVKQRADGACVYLDVGQGCTIYEHRPVICKEFDCRRLYLKMPADIRKRMARADPHSKRLLDAGRERVHTLEEDPS